MKLTRAALRSMILEELGYRQEFSPEDLAQSIASTHSDELAGMTEVEVENLIYTSMSEMGLLDDNWAELMDGTLDILLKMGNGDGESVMGVNMEMEEGSGYPGFGDDEEPLTTLDTSERPNTEILMSWILSKLPKNQIFARHIATNDKMRGQLTKMATTEFPQFTPEEVDQTIDDAVMTVR